MAILKVARLGHPVLRGRANPVAQEQIGDADFQKFIEDMVETMRDYNGVGLAAVQVHEAKQIAVLEVIDNPRYPQKPEVPLTVLINPQITPLSDEMEEDWEGCLSILELRGKVPRYRSIHVQALDRTGRELDFVATHFHARVIQHEWDHLNGKVFIDRMRDFATLTHLNELARYWAGK